MVKTSVNCAQDQSLGMGTQAPQEDRECCIKACFPCSRISTVQVMGLAISSPSCLAVSPLLTFNSGLKQTLSPKSCFCRVFYHSNRKRNLEASTCPRACKRLPQGMLFTTDSDSLLIVSLLSTFSFLLVSSWQNLPFGEFGHYMYSSNSLLCHCSQQYPFFSIEFVVMSISSFITLVSRISFQFIFQMFVSHLNILRTKILLMFFFIFYLVHLLSELYFFLPTLG